MLKKRERKLNAKMNSVKSKGLSPEDQKIKNEVKKNKKLKRKENNLNED